MKKTKQGLDEIRFRVRGTVGLALLGAFLGAIAWLWPALGGQADFLDLVSALGASAGDPYFWAVVSLAAALGGWLAWLVFWRSHRQPDEPNGGTGGGGMSAPKF